MAVVGCMQLVVLLGFSAFSSSTATASSEGRSLRIAGIESAPFLMRNNQSSGEFEGYIVDLLNELEIGEYDILIPEDERYGSFDGVKWNGMIGMLLDGKADMIAADLTITPNRMEVLDFTMPFASAPLTILVKGGGLDFSSPFTLGAWGILVATMLVSGVFFWMVLRISKDNHHLSTEHKVPKSISLSDSFWITATSFLPLGSHKPGLKSISARLMAVGCALFGLAIVVTYAVGALQGSDRHHYASVNELLKKHDFGFIALEGGSTSKLLQTSMDPRMREINRRIMRHPEKNWVSSAKGALDRLLAEETKEMGAVLEWISANSVASHHCSLYTVGSLNDRYHGLALPTGSSRTGHLNAALARLAESGKMQELKNKWFGTRRGSCGVSSVSWPNAAAGRDDLARPLAFLGVVIVLSLVIALAELVCYTRSNPKRPSFAAELKVALCGLNNSSTTQQGEEI